MIVRDAGDHLVLITQPDHAALAARILERWRADDLPARSTRATILLATEEHDNGWLDIDAAPAVDPGTGRPFDFMSIPAAVKQGIWPRAVARLGERSRPAAALVAQHALTIHESCGRDPEWQAFFDRLRDERDRLLAADGQRADRAFLLDYRLVHLGDFLSLAFCNGWAEPFAADGCRFVLRGDELTIAPDPFEGARVALGVRARRIPARPYGSAHELAAELARSAEVVLTGTVVGGERAAPAAPGAAAGRVGASPDD